MGDVAGDTVHPKMERNISGMNEFFHPLADELMSIAARLRDATSPAQDDIEAEQPKIQVTAYQP